MYNLTSIVTANHQSKYTGYFRINMILKSNFIDSDFNLWFIACDTTSHKMTNDPRPWSQSAQS